MVKNYTYLIVYQATLYSGAVIVDSTTHCVTSGYYFEDDEFQTVLFSEAFSDAGRKYNGVSRVTILNVINLTKLKPVMEV